MYGPGSVLVSARFVLSTASKLPLEPTQLPIQGIFGAFSLGLKRQGCEVDYSPPSSVKAKSGGAITPLLMCVHAIVLK
jgi:hypothetical protein